MRTLLVGALLVNLVGCSHQSPPAQTAADSCASTNRLACWLSVRVSIEPTSRTTTNSARLESKAMVARKARETSVSSKTAKHGTRTDAENIGGKSEHDSIMAAW
jgi:hypothetical protein